MEKQNKNKIISRIRGIAIIAVVIGHSNCPYFLYNFCYLFHVPVFFLCSGYCTDIQKIEKKDFPALASLILHRFKRLYFPFLAYSLLGYACLFCININYNFGQYTKAFLFTGQPQVVGVLWFLKSLFVSSTVYYVVLFITKGWTCKDICRFMILCLLLIGGFCLKVVFNGLPYDLHREMMCPILLFLGAFIKQKSHLTLIFENVILLMGLGVMVVLSIYAHIDLAGGEIGDPICFIAVSSFCFITLMTFVKYTPTFLSKVLEVLGDHSLAIMSLHVLSFSILNLCFYDKFSERPVSGQFWYLYSFVGIFVPLLVSLMYYRLKNSL